MDMADNRADARIILIWGMLVQVLSDGVQRTVCRIDCTNV